MAELPPYPGTASDHGVRAESRAVPGTPLWVKVCGIIAVVVIVVVVMMLLAGGHNPGRHT